MEGRWRAPLIPSHSSETLATSPTRPLRTTEPLSSTPCLRTADTARSQADPKPLFLPLPPSLSHTHTSPLPPLHSHLSTPCLRPKEPVVCLKLTAYRVTPPPPPIFLSPLRVCGREARVVVEGDLLQTFFQLPQPLPPLSAVRVREVWSPCSAVQWSRLFLPLMEAATE